MSFFPGARNRLLSVALVLAGGACSDGPTGPAGLADERAAASPDEELAALGESAANCRALVASGATFSTFALTPDGPVPQLFFPLWNGGPPLVPGFQSDASISLTIDGGDASAGLVVTTKLFDESPRGEGTTKASTSHVFELAGSDGDSICEPGEDCFSTSDRTTLGPTGEPGLFRLHGLLAFETGYGMFADPDRHPNLVVRGEIQFAPPQFPTVASWEMSGNFCLGG